MQKHGPRLALDTHPLRAWVRWPVIGHLRRHTPEWARCASRRPAALALGTMECWGPARAEGWVDLPPGPRMTCH